MITIGDKEMIHDQPKREVYHVGFLARDCGDGQIKGRRTEQNQRVAAKRMEAWHLHEKGLVFLVQRKLADEVYEYIMIHRAQRAAK